MHHSFPPRAPAWLEGQGRTCMDSLDGSKATLLATPQSCKSDWHMHIAEDLWKYSNHRRMWFLRTQTSDPRIITRIEKYDIWISRTMFRDSSTSANLITIQCPIFKKMRLWIRATVYLLWTIDKHHNIKEIEETYIGKSGFCKSSGASKCIENIPKHT